MGEQAGDRRDDDAVETYRSGVWWCNRVGGIDLPGSFADRAEAVQVGAGEARRRQVDHVVTFTG